MWILGLKGFNIRKIAKFKSDVYWSERRYSSAKLWRFTDICMVGGKFVTPHANICKISWLWGAKTIFSFQQITFTVGNFTLKVLFSGVSTDFPKLVHVKIWKNLWKDLFSSWGGRKMAVPALGHLQTMWLVRGCLHDTGATFAPVRVHSSSLSWLCFVYMIPPQNVMPAQVTLAWVHPGCCTGARISLRYEI